MEPMHSMRPLRHEMEERDIICFAGIYDAFSASIAGKYYDALFVSGFGFAASYYGLPDIGFITWTDIVAFVQRLRTVLPHHHLLVDIDDGYCDVEVAAHTVSVLESVGASGVVLEDQQRPRRCGHYDGKQLMEMDDYVQKLERVLAARHDLVVVARTDASDLDDILRRVEAYSQAGADAILVDAVHDLSVIRTIKERTALPLVFNQIAGGKSPACNLSDLRAAGVSLVIYSTPCLFAAQEAVEKAMRALRERDGALPDRTNGRVGVSECTAVLQHNLSGDTIRQTMARNH